MRIFTGNIGADACLIEQIGVIIVREGLDPTRKYAAVRALLPDADPSVILALVEQVQEPADPLPAVGLDSEV